MIARQKKNTTGIMKRIYMKDIESKTTMRPILRRCEVSSAAAQSRTLSGCGGRDQAKNLSKFKNIFIKQISTRKTGTDANYFHSFQVLELISISDDPQGINLKLVTRPIRFDEFLANRIRRNRLVSGREKESQSTAPLTRKIPHFFDGLQAQGNNRLSKDENTFQYFKAI